MTKTRSQESTRYREESPILSAEQLDTEMREVDVIPDRGEINTEYNTYTGSDERREIRIAVRDSETVEGSKEVFIYDPEGVSEERAEQAAKIGAVNNDELKRSHIIVYKMTEEGGQALEDKRNEYLRDWVLITANNSLLQPHKETPTLKKSAVVGLIKDEFDLNGAAEDALENEIGGIELATLLAVHYFRESITKELEDPNIEAMAEIVRETPSLRETFTQDSIADRILGEE